jgi:hypothetical protein
MNQRQIIKKLRGDLRHAKDALGLAQSVIEYASMTSWEREACAEDMKKVEAVIEYLNGDVPVIKTERFDAGSKEAALSASAFLILQRLRAGTFYPLNSHRNPKAMVELETSGLVAVAGRVVIQRACYVPARGYTAFVPETVARVAGTVPRPPRSRKPEKGPKPRQSEA